MFPFGAFQFIFSSGSNRSFCTSYRCYSVSNLPGNSREDVEKGGKIILPTSALDILTRLNADYPMVFKLYNPLKDRQTHAGVLEFVADEGTCYLPNWMMANLQLFNGDEVKVESTTLPVATFSKFQPKSIDFLDITNPKAVLENALRNFACLTTGDVISIRYNRKVYELNVLHTLPEKAVTIIECDMNVEFEAPVDCKAQSEMMVVDDGDASTVAEPSVPKSSSSDTECEDPFRGVGSRLDGKTIKYKPPVAPPTARDPLSKKTTPRGVPDYGYVRNTLAFDRSIRPISDRTDEMKSEDGEPKENPFTGSGYTIHKPDRKP